MKKAFSLFSLLLLKTFPSSQNYMRPRRGQLQRRTLILMLLFLFVCRMTKNVFTFKSLFISIYGKFAVHFSF
jgi:hypothetical protein